MKNGDRTKVMIEGAGTFEVEAVNIPGWSFSTRVIVPNQAIRDLAVTLLPGARAMAAARAARLKFLTTSRKSLDVQGAGSHTAAEDASCAARDRAAALELLAEGLAVAGSRTVTLGDWMEILAFFHQDVSVGSVTEVTG